MLLAAILKAFVSPLSEQTRLACRSATPAAVTLTMAAFRLLKAAATAAAFKATAPVVACYAAAIDGLLSLALSALLAAVVSYVISAVAAAAALAGLRSPTCSTLLAAVVLYVISAVAAAAAAHITAIVEAVGEKQMQLSAFVIDITPFSAAATNTQATEMVPAAAITPLIPLSTKARVLVMAGAAATTVVSTMVLILAAALFFVIAGSPAAASQRAGVTSIPAPQIIQAAMVVALMGMALLPLSVSASQKVTFMTRTAISDNVLLLLQAVAFSTSPVATHTLTLVLLMATST